MADPPDALFEKVRQQYETLPYLNVPLDISPREQAGELFIRNFLTPYYLRNRRLISTAGKVILDAGCGTGYKSLMLAEANPGAKIVGIDLSSTSIAISRQRLTLHGFDNAEFFVASFDDLPGLGFEFDYIHCDEVLSLVPDPIAALQTMKAVLKPEGIIRANLHNSLSRSGYLRAQRVFKLLGLMDRNPEDQEVQAVIDIFESLNDWVDLKARMWKGDREIREDKESILMNYLLQGDKGFMVTDLFAALQEADLELIQMVNWRRWDLLQLFENSEDLPAPLAETLPNLPLQQRLQLFEQLHPMHRLLDFWCGHPDQAQPEPAIATWSEADWQPARIHLHPQLKTPRIRADLLHSAERREPFEISRYIPLQARAPILLKSAIAAALLPLWEGPQSIATLVERLLTVQPLDLVTLEPLDHHQAFTTIQTLLIQLEELVYVLLER